MRITKIKLKNFLGLYNGSGKKEIEIDFSTGLDNKINILSGGNGKGKSFLISCLHPFSSTLDNRTKIIMDNESGYKEIHYSINTNEKVIIKHNYILGKTGKITMKSFFQYSNDGGVTYNELNPNGTVNSFKELVLKYLEVDEAYFKIARIGTNVTNFIDMSTADRKKYISLFLPDVDVYLENYKKFNEKYNTINKTIKFITGEIDKIENEENLKSQIKNTENTLETIKKSLDLNKESLNKNLGIISTLDPDGKKEQEFLESYNKFNLLKKKIEDCNKPLDELNKDLNGIDINKVINKLNIVEINKTNKKEKLDELKNSLSDINAELEENEIKLLKIDLDNEEEIQSILKSNKDKISIINNSLKDPINKINMKYANNISISEIDSAIKTLDFYKQQSETILSLYDLEIINFFLENKLTKEIIVAELDSLNQLYKENKTKYSTLTISLRDMNSKLELLDTLAKRPTNCKIDTCPFISKALANKDIESDIERTQNNIISIEEIMDELKIKIDMYNKILELYNQLFNLYTFINKEKDILIKLPYYDELFKSYDLFIKTIMKDKDLLDYKPIKEIIELNIELNELNKINENLQLKLDNMNSKKELVESLDKDNKRLNERLNKTKILISELEKELDKLKDSSIKLSNIKLKLEKKEEITKQLKEYTEEQIELKMKLKNLKDDINKLKVVKKENKELNETIKKLEVQFKPLEKTKESLKVELKRLYNFIEKRKVLEEDYKDMAIIRDALSTTKGIPLLFIDLYLKKIKTIANELLDISFNGNFFIEDFKVTESDFFISVRKAEGEIVSDISQASQGEQALTSIALSFALVQQSTRNYNVLALDEMDSTLDNRNRQAFIEVIETQLKEMNVEQCFIISHNEAFDTYPINLILFEGTNVDINDKEYMKNKKVLYQNK